MKPITIDDIKVMNLGLGRSIYSPAQLEEFACYQESQGTRRAFLAVSAERAYNIRSGGQWGSGLSDLDTESLIDAVGYHLVPMYWVIRPTAAVALLVLFLVGILRMLLDIMIRAIAIARNRGCGWWLMGAFWGHRRGGRAIGSQDAAQQLGQARELVQRVPRHEGHRSGLFGTTPKRIGLLGKPPSSEAFVPLHKPVGVLASYVQMQV